MAKWIRSGDVPQLQKAAFQVDASAHPELAEWLWNLPRNKASEAIRNLLLRGLELATSDSLDFRTVATGKRKKILNAPQSLYEKANNDQNQRSENETLAAVLPAPSHVLRKKNLQHEPETIVLDDSNEISATSEQTLSEDQLNAMRQLGSSFE